MYRQLHEVLEYTRLVADYRQQLSGQTPEIEQRGEFIPFALDESIADLAEENQGRFEQIKEDLKLAFQSGNRGCACFVLKPALLGVEQTIQDLTELTRVHRGSA